MIDNQEGVTSCNMNALRLKEALQEQGRIVSVPVGVSMWPMLIHRKDHIVIETVKEPLKRYDVPLYQRGNGHFVLHRIIKVCGNGQYIINGDNVWRKEYDITDEQIHGVLVGFFKGDVYIDCEKSKGYRIYVIICRMMYPIRAIFLFTKEKARRFVYRLRKD